MIAYAYKANAILVKPLKNKTGNSLFQAYHWIYDQLDAVWFKPALHVLKNEASSDFKLFLKNTSRLPTSASMNALPPLSRKGNLAIQKAFHCRTVFHP